ncbi:MAG: Ig-like domain-containing protein, partial [Fastidiosipila sp.]|nr:Ig-like domain-containing protein [Fastidiosipila sp.]
RVTKDLLVGTYNFSFPAGLVKDDHGNKSAAFSVTVNVGATPTSPVKPVVSLISSANNVFKLKFTEEMGSSAVNLANYKLDGNALPAGTTAYFDDADKDSVTITLPANSITITGPAILTVSNVADKFGVVALTTNLPVNIVDNTAPTVVSAPAHNATAKTITYTFSEPVKLLSGDTTNHSKYGIYKVTDGDYGPDVVAGTSIVLVTMTGNSLTFTYTGSLTSGTYIVDAWGDKIVDAAGNVIANIDVDATNYLFTVN